MSGDRRRAFPSALYSAGTERESRAALKELLAAPAHYNTLQSISQIDINIYVNTRQGNYTGVRPSHPRPAVAVKYQVELSFTALDHLSPIQQYSDILRFGGIPTSLAY